MQKYIGVERFEARPMTLGDYNTYRGWQMKILPTRDTL
jgi:hypothetical protein